MRTENSTKCILLFVIYLLGQCHAPPQPTKDPLLTYSLMCSSEIHYCYQAFNKQVTYVDAWCKCHSLGMHLAMPRTQQEMDFIRNNILGTSDHEPVWIGLRTIDEGASWTWQDNRNLDITNMQDPWKTGQPTDVLHSRDMDVYKACIEIEQEGWSNKDCNTKLLQYLCQNYTNGCHTDAPYQYGDYCYHVVTSSSKWSTSLCDEGQLAMPKTDAINSYIYEINYGNEDLWIGLHRPIGPPSVPFVWLDNTNITLTYLESHVVDNSSIVRTSYDDEQFAYMTHAGAWDTKYVYEKVKMAYVCQVEIETTSEITVEDCGPLAIQNGRNITVNTTEGHSHDVICNYGYVSTNNSVSCQTNGQWYPIVSCTLDIANFCLYPAHVTSNNLTLEKQVALLEKLLLVDVSQLSSTRRKMTSAEDNRTSAKSIGASGVFIMIIFFSLFVFNDLFDIVLCVKERKMDSDTGRSR